MTLPTCVHLSYASLGAESKNLVYSQLSPPPWQWGRVVEVFEDHKASHAIPTDPDTPEAETLF